MGSSVTSWTSADTVLRFFYFLNSPVYTQQSTSGLSLDRNLLFLAFEMIRRSPEAEHAAVFKCSEDEEKMSFAIELHHPRPPAKTIFATSRFCSLRQAALVLGLKRLSILLTSCKKCPLKLQ